MKKEAVDRRLWAVGQKEQADSESDLLPTAYSLQPTAPLASRARGFSLVAALFLIVVVAALGAFAVRIGASQQQTVNLSLLSARALAAANSGIEFGAYQALNASSCVAATLTLTEAGANGFSVAVTCSASAHAESGGTVNIYRIDATATAGTYGMPDYVSRHVYATFASAP
jgi:MSHA biogenesis protein MshP